MMIGFREGKMRFFKIFLITISLICLWMLNGYADRLYTWIDDKGVSHISQDPPPSNAALIDIMDYTSHPEKQNQAVQVQDKKPKKIEPEKTKAEAGEASEEAGEILEPENYYEGGSDTSRYKREKRKKKRIEKVKDKHNTHKSRK
ncbi:MAG: DUF4124 domain-containing protein [Proteobacteria bacterium]|nr:DUF4124 domain-containing protein [Pseudomonadota bacterium]